MDGREKMEFPGSAPYYHNRGGIGNSTSGLNVHTGFSTGVDVKPIHTGFSAGIDVKPNFTTFPNPNVSIQQSASTFHVETPPSDFPRGIETVKKKRGRPRKYGPDGGAKMSLQLSPTGAINSEEKRRKGRPPGSGWKQQLALNGEWMNNTAGLAFTPHVLHIGVGEDIAAKIFAFSQQRARALCILSANGSVSAITLQQLTDPAGTVTYEGRFEILCLSGSYLVAESGGPRNRTGGISISVCTPDGHIIGGAIGGNLIAASPVQVVACSFVYDGTKAKNKVESETKDEKHLLVHCGEKSLTPVSAPTPSQSLTPKMIHGIQ